MGYTLQQIRDARAFIKNVMVIEVLDKKGREHLTSFSGSDLEYLFGLYDDTFFQGQILKKIADTDSVINFYARSRTSGVAGVCGVKTIDSRKYYYLDIAPQIIETLYRYNKLDLPMAAGIGCNDRLSCVQLIMEHEIIHLISLLYGYLVLPPGPKIATNTMDPKANPHGPLFQCMVKEYFGHSTFDHDLGLTTVISIVNQPTELGTGVLPSNFLKYKATRGTLVGAGFQNWAESCYIDSILMVLFDTVSPFWRRHIMDVDVASINYSGKVCTDSEINTVGKLRTLTQKIQTQIKKDYATLHTKRESTVCTQLRSLLAECVPSMRPKGKWVMFNTGATYDALVMVFPDLAIDIPYHIHRWSSLVNDYITDSVDYVTEASLTVWDYMDPLTDIEAQSDYKEIRWDLIDSPVLVFYNGGTPRVRNFITPGVEKSYVHLRGDRGSGVQKYEFDITKARVFGETIIDDRYRIIGVVTLEGVSPVSEGGSHYTAHYLGTDNNWYYYNDIGPTIVKVDGLPMDGVWLERGQKMPSMYFYQRVRSPDFGSRPAKLVRSLARPIGLTPKQSIKTLELPTIKGLRYKKVIRGNNYLYFVYDDTPDQRLATYLDDIGTQFPFTLVTPTVRMWKVNERDSPQLERHFTQAG